MYVKSLSVRAMNSLSTCPKLGIQRLHLCPTMDTQALSSVPSQPSPPHALLLQTVPPQHIPTRCDAHASPKWTLSQRRGAGITRNIAARLSVVYTLSLRPSFACSLSVCLFPDAEGSRIHLAIYVSCQRIL